MNELAEKIKIATLAYWRFIRHHPVGAIECKAADVLTVTRTLMLTESEVKTNIADMQREVSTKQYKHLRMRGQYPSLYPSAHYFYFVVPEELQDKALQACDERYPYAGLLIFQAGTLNIYKPENIIRIRQSKRFKRRKVDNKELLEIAYGSSATALRFANRWLMNFDTLKGE